MNIWNQSAGNKYWMHLILLPMILLPFSLSGRTILVSPGDDIADSLLSLAQGDTLFLTPGIYTDASDHPLLAAGPLQSGVTVTSMPDNRAILDGQDSTRSIITLQGPHTSEIVIENLVITGGNATIASAFKGGGIYASESSVLISNCLFSENRALFGGGIGTEGGSIRVLYSILSCNEALATGGGIDLYACDFIGFMLKLISNTCSDDGGGIHAYQSTSSLSNALFYDNYAGDDGGAITILQGTADCSFLTIDSNEAFDDGGGIRLHTVDWFSLYSSIVTSNLGKAGINVKRTDSLIVSHNCCWRQSIRPFRPA